MINSPWRAQIENDGKNRLPGKKWRPVWFLAVHKNVNFGRVTIYNGDKCELVGEYYLTSVY